MLAVVLSLVVAQDPAGLVPLALESAGGLYRAEVARAPGQERVPDALARWRLAVRALPVEAGAEPLWSCNYPHRATPRWHLLSDDGLAFAAVEREYHESRTLVSVWRAGERLAELSATQLDIDRSRLPHAEPRPWLDERGPRVEWGETSRGPRLYLTLPTAYGESRHVDLADGSVRRALGELTDPWAEPPASRVEKPGLRACITERFTIPATIAWGEALEVRVGGDHATPNWMFVGFELALDPEDPRMLVLTPISAPPPQGTRQTRAMQHFDAVGHVKGLMPGRYRLRIGECARGVEPQPFEVLPARPFLELERRGGIAGIVQSLRVYPSGVVVDEWSAPPRDPPRTYRMLTLEQARRLADAARAIEPFVQRADGRVSDALRCVLTIWDGERPRRAEFEDSGASGPLRELVALLTL